MTAVFVLNNLVLLTLETPGFLVINLISYGSVVTFSIIGLRNLKAEEKIQDQKPLDLSKDAEAVDKVYHDLKILLAQSIQKESLPMAKELARICSELGPVAAELNEKVEEKLPPRPSPFKQGSLRSAFRIAS